MPLSNTGLAGRLWANGELGEAWRRCLRTGSAFTRGAKREVLTLLLCLGLGIVLMPMLIWLVGSRTLGPYTNGGPLSLWRDFAAGLVHGSLAFWLVALGP